MMFKYSVDTNDLLGMENFLNLACLFVVCLFGWFFNETMTLKQIRLTLNAEFSEFNTKSKEMLLLCSNNFPCMLLAGNAYLKTCACYLMHLVYRCRPFLKMLFMKTVEMRMEKIQTNAFLVRNIFS